MNVTDGRLFYDYLRQTLNFCHARTIVERKGKLSVKIYRRWKI
jgi:hypothetical protein